MKAQPRPFMRTIVKICGLKTQDTVDAAVKAGADMVGFVVFDRSPRHISLDAAASLGARVGPGAAKVLLTVDADDASLAAAIAALDPAFLQLHGAESPERVAAIRAGFGVKVIKALGIAERADLEQIRCYDDIADMLLLDARPGPDDFVPAAMASDSTGRCWPALQRKSRGCSPAG